MGREGRKVHPEVMKTSKDSYTLCSHRTRLISKGHGHGCTKTLRLRAGKVRHVSHGEVTVCSHCCDSWGDIELRRRRDVHAIVSQTVRVSPAGCKCGCGQQGGESRLPVAFGIATAGVLLDIAQLIVLVDHNRLVRHVGGDDDLRSPGVDKAANGDLM